MAVLNTPLTELIKRLRILTVSLLPLEVDPRSINDPTSRIITPKVISAYIAAGGDLVEAVCHHIVSCSISILVIPTAALLPPSCTSQLHDRS